DERAVFDGRPRARARSDLGSVSLERGLDVEQAYAEDLVRAGLTEIGRSGEEDLGDLLATELRPILLQQSSSASDGRGSKAVAIPFGEVAVRGGDQDVGCHHCKSAICESAGSSVPGNGPEKRIDANAKQ